MSLSDWTDKKNGGQMVLTLDEVKEGLRSLEITSIVNDYAIKTLDQTETDTPADINVEFFFYLPGAANALLAHFFRYQDLNNYYSIQVRVKGSADSYIYLYLRESGNLSLIDSGTIPNPYLAWQKVKLRLCGLGDNVYVEVYTDTSGNEVFVLRDILAHGTAKFTGGGAYGVGFEEHSAGGNKVAYLDTTKVYYEI